MYYNTDSALFKMEYFIEKDKKHFKMFENKML